MSYNGLRSRISADGELLGTAQTHVVGIEDYVRTLAPALIGYYEQQGYCWVITGSTESGRAYADSGGGAAGDRLLPRSGQREGTVRLPLLALRGRRGSRAVRL